MKTPTQEMEEEKDGFFVALLHMFRPFVEAAVRPKVEAEMSKGPLFTKEQSENIVKAVKEMRTDLPAEAQVGMRKFAEMVQDPRPFTADEIEQAVQDETNNATMHLVRNWLEVFSYRSVEGALIRDEVQDWLVSGASLDDAMLPPLDIVIEHGNGKTVVQLFAECCNQILDASETRAVLCQVKQSLPPGKVMPDEAIKYLDFMNVLIVL